ncbi:MAG: lysine--tRNA ligase, partial [Saprospiraceae bacterium]|nr:lysine--tRNA ligase [Saprospiraceae bacterium]
MHLSEQELVRRDNLQKIRDLGIDPYPPIDYPVTALAANIKTHFQDDDDTYDEVVLAGRLMMKRIMGKASFAELQDSSGRIQLYISRDEICPGDDKDLYNTVFKKLLDIGDFIGVKGKVFRTKVGEISVHVHELVLLSKSLKPLPIVKTKVDEQTGETHTYDAFTDPELRYRQRYVDLVVNPQYKQIFNARAKVIREMRRFFDDKGWLEVETPILQPVHGGAAARPFKTH